MLCTRCHKNPAVVFFTQMDQNAPVNQGYCLKCALELNIRPVSDMIEKMGISPEDLESLSTEMNEMLTTMNQDNSLQEECGAATFPLMNNLFTGGRNQPETQGEPAQKEKTEREKKHKKQKNLDSYCINLTDRARRGEMDTIIGRDKELYRVIQILNRRTKNNPCLIGEPGVGKTAVAEALAQRIAAKTVPYKLQDKEIYLLDMTALVAGTQFRGQFESRIKGLIDEIKSLGNVILVIDEVHNMVGAGDAEGSMNAANILKPALSRGEIQVIGATTFHEYRKYIEKDSALERRFQPVRIDEPTIDDTVKILEGIKHYYETYHGVSIDDETVRQAVLLSERYVTDRYLPDKAIDLIDEAASAANIENNAANDLLRMNRELEAVHSRQEELSGQDDVETYKELADLRAEECRLKEQISQVDTSSLTVKVGVEQLANIIELWTGIPATKIKEAEFAKLATLEEKLKMRVVGQDEAVTAVCNAIRRNRVGISPKRKPVSFIFCGPTGVGKTELVKTVAGELFDSVETLIRLDMSEFMEKHAVSRIIGAPPGYVGYDEAGQLTEKIRRKPYSVVLFDEIEKAHPDVMNILLQILDEGRITDAHGRTVNFENTIIVMTSNAGSDRKEGMVGFNSIPGQANKDRTMKALSEFLRPEFINRVDEIITFNQLTQADFARIAGIMLRELQDSLGEKQILFGYTDEVVDLLVQKSYSMKFGARNLRRTIQKEIEDLVANTIIHHYEQKPTALTLVVRDGAFALEY